MTADQSNNSLGRIREILAMPEEEAGKLAEFSQELAAFKAGTKDQLELQNSRIDVLEGKILRLQSELSTTRNELLESQGLVARFSKRLKNRD